MHLSKSYYGQKAHKHNYFHQKLSRNPPEIISEEINTLTQLIIQHCFVPFLTPDSIEKLNLQSDETLWMLRFTTNNYSIKDIIGYEDENMQIFNQTLEYINHEN